jgi:hypothetical protein
MGLTRSFASSKLKYALALLLVTVSTAAPLAAAEDAASTKSILDSPQQGFYRVKIGKIFGRHSVVPRPR